MERKRLSSMAKKTIMRRWATNNLGVIFLILLFIGVLMILWVKSYYYTSAQQYLESKLNAVNGILTRYASDSNTNLSTELRSTLEGFSDKERMELMAIDREGRIVLTSSGFSSERLTNMPDYDSVCNGSSKFGYHIGYTENGEHTMAVSYSIQEISNEYSAIRVITSLDAIDRTVRTIGFIIILLALSILGLLGITGLYFVGSIVRPIQDVNETSQKIASGDFSARINHRNTDEIGELCVSINHMADALGTMESMKNEFISSVSHELRTPLTAIKGWAETLNEGETDPEMMQKGLRVIVGETERLSNMVEELLDFSRMQSGHFTLQLATMDVLAELGDAVLIYVERAHKDGVRVTYEEPEMLPFVYGDKSRIRQVFINIIDNAIKYSEKDGLVEITAEARGDEEVIVTVKDHGCGIKESDLPKIKTKFYKPNHTKRGSGIGLAVADEIVTMHGGTLTIHSQEGVGTTVIITLPAQQGK